MKNGDNYDKYKCLLQNKTTFFYIHKQLKKKRPIYSSVARCTVIQEDQSGNTDLLENPEFSPYRLVKSTVLELDELLEG